MSYELWLNLDDASLLCAVSPLTLQRWTKHDGVLLRRQARGEGVYWEDLCKCLERRGFPALSLHE